MSLTHEMTAFERGWFAGLELEPEMLLSDWADEHRILNQKSSSEPGKWRTARTPYLKEIMDCLSPVCDEVNEVTWMKGTQIGATECGNNWIGYIIHKVPGPTLAVQPTVDLGKRLSRQRIAPMIQDSPELKARIQDSRSRDSGNTTLLKEFDGGMLIISGANSAAGLRSMPIRNLFLDEVDGYPLDVDGEGDPVELAINRTQNFSLRKKILRVSTPTVAGLSRIEQSFLLGDQRYYFVPCPHCDVYQVLEWNNIHWEDSDPATTKYVCPHCASIIRESNKTWMLDRGEWRPTEKPKNTKHQSYHINSLYSPLGWESWNDIVSKFLEAKADIEKMKTWKNTKMALTWKEQVNDVQADTLRERAEKYPLRRIPTGAVLLVSGTDVQHDRLETVIYAYAQGEKCWVIDYHVIYGDPGEEEIWAELDEYLITPIPYEDGGELRVMASAVDSGGHHTHEVYNFCRARKHRKVMAIKGASKTNAPILGKATLVDVNSQGRIIKHGCRLWNIGVHAAKHVIYSRLSRKETGPGYIHLSSELPEDFFNQIVAEKLTRRYKKGFPVYEWIKASAQNNEVLDCTVYAYAAALRMKVNKMSDGQWEQLRKEAIGSTQQSLFATPQPSSRKDAPTTNGKFSVKKSFAS